MPFRGVRARVGFDASVLRLDSVVVSQDFSFPAPIMDTSEPGVVEVGGSSRSTLDGAPIREVARLFFTVVGGAGSSVTTSTVLTLLQNENAIPVLDLSPFRVVESTLEIGGGG
jgi:hypothetical protein